MMQFSQTQIARMQDMQDREANRKLLPEFSALVGASQPPVPGVPQPAPAPVPVPA
jgi:hypothetical protein